MVTLDLQAELARLVAEPARVSTSESVLRLHGEDLTYHRPHLPDVVVFAKTREEVSAVLAFANERRIPVTPFGTGTSLEGHVIPYSGGISLDLTQMNRIVEVRPEDFLAVVEPGVVRSQLNAAAVEHGLSFPVDPGADCSLGGMAACNASGTTAVRYGVMRDQVLALEVVLADGTIVRTGSRAKKTSAGYDLTSLVVGSEGTLGVITQLTVRLHGIPERLLAARAIFPSIDAACETAAAVIASGVPVERCELVDAITVHAINAYKGTSYPEAPMLLLEFGGSPASVEADRALVEELARELGCTEFAAETDSRERARLWEARHDAAHAVTHSAPGKRHKSTDVCVPISQLPAAIRFGRETMERHGLVAAILGHVGDGNYHAAIMLDPDDPDELARVERANEELVLDALERGGTCTGEHGVGVGKIPYLEREHGDLMPAMRAVKAALDPNGILNPGKVVG